ncbi:MAG: response regulator [Anaerolineae bacterium]
MMDIDKAAIKQWAVLVVDDDADNREVARRLFSMFGAQVKTAENGKEGLQCLDEMTPTLILLDISMPVMDGWEMLYILRNEREEDGLADVPVIALTAHAMAGDESRVMNAGFDGYITNPFNTRSLLQDVYAMVEGSDKTDNDDDDANPDKNGTPAQPGQPVMEGETHGQRKHA